MRLRDTYPKFQWLIPPCVLRSPAISPAIKQDETSALLGACQIIRLEKTQMPSALSRLCTSGHRLMRLRDTYPKFQWLIPPCVLRHSAISPAIKQDETSALLGACQIIRLEKTQMPSENNVLCTSGHRLMRLRDTYPKFQWLIPPCVLRHSNTVNLQPLSKTKHRHCSAPVR
jgi:hypothetical protein